jgi:hypothetical protein
MYEKMAYPKQPILHKQIFALNAWMNKFRPKLLMWAEKTIDQAPAQRI